MSARDIKVYNIGRTEPDMNEVEDWLEGLGVSEEYIERLHDDIDSGKLMPAEVIPGLAAKRCYMSFEPELNSNLTKVRDDWGDYFDNVLKSKHGAVLEHSVFNFAFEGVTRVFTGEMNRHRAGWAISEGSMRFIAFDKDIGYWLPTSIDGPELPLLTGGMINNVDYRPCKPEEVQVHIDDRPEGERLDLRKQLTREIFDDVFTHVQKRYSQLQAIWGMDDGDKNFHYKKKVTSCLRRIVPMGVSTGGVWSGNIRALRHVLTLRCDAAAEEEIQLVFSTVAKLLSEKYKNVFGDFVQDPETKCWKPKHWYV